MAGVQTAHELLQGFKGEPHIITTFEKIEHMLYKIIIVITKLNFTARG